MDFPTNQLLLGFLLSLILIIGLVISGIKLFKGNSGTSESKESMIKTKWLLPVKKGAWVGSFLGFLLGYLVATFRLAGGPTGHLGIPPVIFLPIYGPFLAMPSAIIGGLVGGLIGYFLRSGWKLDH